MSVSSWEIIIEAKRTIENIYKKEEKVIEKLSWRRWKDFVLSKEWRKLGI